LLEVSESILESQAYPDLLEDYEETFLAAAADPSDDNIAAAAGAKAALDESAQAALTNYKAAKESVEYDSSRLYNMQQMLAALNTVTYAINDAANDAAAEAVITDRRYIEVLEDEKLRPLRLAELDEIFEIEEERNINVRAFLRYGDLATQVGVTPIIKALAREDFGAHIIHMTSESLIDVAFELSLPDAASSEKDNAFNGAKLWLGKDGACVSAVGSDAALNDVFGVLLEESPDNIFTATQTISDEITLRYDQISLVRTTDDALFIEDALGYENP
jgi:hypothetical protein